MNRIKQTIIALAIGLSLANCGDDFLDTTSSDQMSDSNTFTTIDGAQQVLTGAYDWLTNGWLAHMTNQYIFFLPDIMGDDALVTPTTIMDVLCLLINIQFLQEVPILMTRGRDVTVS